VNRALRAATMGVLLLSPVVLSACSAGQVTQTATQERDKVGAMAQAGDLTIRAVRLESPRGGTYDSGDDAELQVAIVNAGDEPDALVGISGEGFGDVEFDSGSTATASPSATPTATASPSATPTPTATPGSRSSSDTEIEIPARATIFIGTDGASVTLTDLEQSLTTGQYLELTFEFEKAGEVTLPVTVATPDEALERGEAFDFHQEEGTEPQG
jgi:copper(I)-binding protein